MWLQANKFLINGIFSSLVGIQNRISQGLKVLQYYTTKNWVFKNEKFLQMKQKMSPDDRKRFYFSVEEVNSVAHLTLFVFGLNWPSKEMNSDNDIVHFI